MSKKLFLGIVFSLLFTILFAFSVSATVYYYEEGASEPLFQYETKDAVDVHSQTKQPYTLIDTYDGQFPKTDAEGNALTWYVVSTTTNGADTIKTVKSVLTTDTRYFTIDADGVYQYGGTDGNPVTQYNVVSVNFPHDSGIKKLGLENDGYRVGNIYEYDYNSTEILYLYLPKTLTTLNERIAQNTKVLVCDIPFEVTASKISHVAFYHAKNLKEINIPTTVKSIDGKGAKDGSAFYGCEQLEAVYFHKDSQLETIGIYAFNKCYALKDVLLPDTVKTVGEYAFYGTAIVNSPFTKNAIATLGKEAFGWCSNLKNFIFPAGVKEVKATDTLVGCGSLERVEFANNSQTTKILDDAFRPRNTTLYSFSKLTYISLPDSVTYVGEEAFRWLPLVESPFSKTSQCEYIGHMAFEGCGSLVNINIPKNTQFNMKQNLEKAGVFSNCKSLKTVYFHEDSTTLALPKYMFAYCEKLTYIKIPNSVKTISIRTFDRCTSLETVILGAGLEFMNAGRNDTNEDHNSLFYNCLALKNVYISSTLDLDRIGANQCHCFTTADSAIQGTYQKVAYFYNVNTAEEANALKNAFSTKVTNCGRNDRITNATVISLAEFNAKFPDKSQAYDKNYIVYGINTCDAFYNGEHDVVLNDGSQCKGVCNVCKTEQIDINADHDVVWVFNGNEGVSILSVITAKNTCKHCSTVTETKEIDKIFENFGFSSEIGGDGVYQKTKINKESIALYAALTGNEDVYNYGVFVGLAYDENDAPIDGALITVNDENKAVAINSNSTVIATFANTEFTYITIKVTGISEGTPLYFGAFAQIGKDITYISGDNEGNKAVVRIAE